MLNRVVLIGFINVGLLIQGCTSLTPEQIRMRDEAAAQAWAQALRNERAKIENVCLSYGFEKGAPSFAQCVQGEYEKIAKIAAMNSCIANLRTDDLICSLKAQGSGLRVGDATATANQRICDDRHTAQETLCRITYGP